MDSSITLSIDNKDQSKNKNKNGSVDKGGGNIVQTKRTEGLVLPSKLAGEDRKDASARKTYNRSVSCKKDKIDKDRHAKNKGCSSYVRRGAAYVQSESARCC